MPRWPWRRASEPDPLGTGLWRRCYDTCVTAARAAPALEPLLAQVRTLAESSQSRWPSETLDVPSDAGGRSAHQHLNQVQQAFREAAYRTRLAAAATCADERLRQSQRAQAAVADAVRSLESRR